MDTCCYSSLHQKGSPEYWDEQFDVQSVHSWTDNEHHSFKQMSGHFDITDKTVLLAGAGNSSIVEEILSRQPKLLIVNDISEAALRQVEARLSEDQRKQVLFIADSIVNPSWGEKYWNQIDFWYDRATLHFFTSCADKDAYFEQVNRFLESQGTAFFSVFTKENKAECCGLTVQLWSEQSLINRMPQFELKHSFEDQFNEHNGELRNYIHTLFEKR